MNCDHFSVLLRVTANLSCAFLDLLRQSAHFAANPFLKPLYSYLSFDDGPHPMYGHVSVLRVPFDSRLIVLSQPLQLLVHFINLILIHAPPSAPLKKSRTSAAGSRRFRPVGLGAGLHQTYMACLKSASL